MRSFAKKITLISLCFSFIITAGCAKSTGNSSSQAPSVPTINSSEEAPVQTGEFSVNPLTGICDLDPQMAKKRPVAIMVNNLKQAQAVQTGLNQADIIYETEVEGGITRLLAVYQDVTRAEKIGTIRSARYVYIDLAMGHNAFYIHHGTDGKYAKPHLKDTTAVTISAENYGARIKNGLASEHTLYGYGEKLWKGLENKGYKTENSSAKSWQSFADENEKITLENTASSVTIPFSGSYITKFKYDSSNGLYTRYFGSDIRKDYVTGKPVQVKNVFVCLTSITNYPDNYHRKVSLESGNGYYIVNGTYTPIKWSKGAAKNAVTFKNSDGTELKVNAGSSWVCFASSKVASPSFE